MLIDFFLHLRQAKIPVSINEYLTLLEGMKQKLIGPSIDEFYLLSRATMVKDERNFDKFDRAFGAYFKGVENLDLQIPDLAEDWLKRQFNREFTAEEKAAIEAMGGLDKLMERLKELLDEQKERHEGGNKWIGTNGTSPFGNGGYNPAGNRTAVKVWEQRAYRDYDDQVELGTRNIKIALRRLRKFAREGAEEELDLDDTIASTARNAGYLDLKLVPERHNTVKVLMLLDVGGTMDDHIDMCSKLFSAAKYEFKHLEFYYFHNCLYERLWKENRRRFNNITPTFDVMNKFNDDYRLIIVGDASMSPWEILHPGGSVEHNNPESGLVWMERITKKFKHHVWINPNPEDMWDYSESTRILKQVMNDRMFPLTMEGLSKAMQMLKTANKRTVNPTEA